MSDSLDTCTIVSLLVGKPERQATAVGELLDSGAIHNIADLAICETVYVLETRYGNTRSDIVKMLEIFLENYDSSLNYNRTLFDLVFPFYEAHPALSFNDCCLAAYAELGHAEPLFTFDRKLARQHPSAKMLQM